MTDRDQRGTNWPVTRLQRVRGAEAPPLQLSPPEPYEPSEPVGTTSVRSLVLASLGELRRRWLLALTVALLVMGPVFTYAVLAVPTYTAEGVLQVSEQGGGANPLLELTGGGARGDVETEVQILRRRQFLLNVLEDLRLHVVDPEAPRYVTTDIEVAMGARSPLTDELRRVRASFATLTTDPAIRRSVPLTLTSIAEDRVRVRVGGPDGVEREVALGETLVDEPLTLALSSLPVDVGETITVDVLSNGQLLDRWSDDLRVSSLGTSAQATNLVSVRFTHPDRQTARAVVQRIMERYLDQSLTWQSLSASNSADFIAKRLTEAEQQLQLDEEQLRQFAEREHAVRLDTQAEVTIESTADLEAEKRQIELQERVIGSVLTGMKKRGGGNASLTSNFFDDPILAANVAALTEAETQRSVLRATHTDDHPQVVALDEQIRQRHHEITKLLRSAQRSLSARRVEIDKELEEAMGSLSAYPDKELELARHRRDVEVDQRLYSYLLEKFQEAEILEASTTTDKRIVDPASLPHTITSPARPILVLTGTMAGLILACMAVYLAHLLQRRLGTVEQVKVAVPYAVYGTVPAIDLTGSGKHGKKRGRRAKPDAGQRIAPAAVWQDAHGPAAEAFRALAVSVSLTPAVSGRARLVQVTSSQPGEGKSTVISNLAVSLSKAGARVLVIDLDLRKPVQHRYWSIPRAPGYSDLLAKGSGPEQARGLLRRIDPWNVDVLTAGTKLPDTMGALMGQTLESMLVYWSERYDYVLLDSPPAFVSDAAILGRHADLILLVARPGVVERNNIRHAAATLSRLEAFKGLVLNNVERKHAEYYYGGYYYAGTYSVSEDGERQAAS